MPITKTTTATPSPTRKILLVKVVTNTMILQFLLLCSTGAVKLACLIDI